MKNLRKFKSRIVLIFIGIILSSQGPLYACTFTLNPVLPVAAEAEISIPTAEHKRIVNDYITQLKAMHNGIFQLVQFTLDISSEDIAMLNQRIDAIKGEINSTRRRMREYSIQVENDPIQNRDMLLLFNTLNHINTQLLYLEQLSTATSNAQKIFDLEIFFRARGAASDTLIAIEDFIAEE